MSSRTAPRSQKVDRRSLLLQTAEELFADHGIDAVSLNEINKAAGQRNTSAIHYHFGNKERLVQTIIYEHYAAIDEHINTLLDDFEAIPKSRRSPRDLLRALLMPFVAQLDSKRGINYLLIVRQVLAKSSDMLISGHPEGEDRARLRVFELSRQLLPDLPSPIRRSRMELCAGLIFNALASRARGERGGIDDRDLFVSELLDNLQAVLTSRPSKETLEILG